MARELKPRLIGAPAPNGETTAKDFEEPLWPIDRDDGADKELYEG